MRAQLTALPFHSVRLRNPLQERIALFRVHEKFRHAVTDEVSRAVQFENFGAAHIGLQNIAPRVGHNHAIGGQFKEVMIKRFGTRLLRRRRRYRSRGNRH